MMGPSIRSTVRWGRGALGPSPARRPNRLNKEPRKKKSEMTARRDRTAMILANRLMRSYFPVPSFDADARPRPEHRGKTPVKVFQFLHRAAVPHRNVPE